MAPPGRKSVPALLWRAGRKPVGPTGGYTRRGRAEPPDVPGRAAKLRANERAVEGLGEKPRARSGTMNLGAFVNAPARTPTRSDWGNGRRVEAKRYRRRRRMVTPAGWPRNRVLLVPNMSTCRLRMPSAVPRRAARPADFVTCTRHRHAHCAPPAIRSRYRDHRNRQQVLCWPYGYLAALRGWRPLTLIVSVLLTCRRKFPESVNAQVAGDDAHKRRLN
jgi:hypothetical protein